MSEADGETRSRGSVKKALPAVLGEAANVCTVAQAMDLMA